MFLGNGIVWLGSGGGEIFGDFIIYYLSFLKFELIKINEKNLVLFLKLFLEEIIVIYNIGDFFKFNK